MFEKGEQLEEWCEIFDAQSVLEDLLFVVLEEHILNESHQNNVLINIHYTSTPAIPIDYRESVSVTQCDIT